MRSHLRVSLGVVVAFILIVPATYGVAAKPGPKAAQGHQGMGGMQHGMQMVAPADKLMRDLDSMMADLTTAMHAFRASHDPMAGQSHGPIVGSMQGMLDQMRQFQEALRQTSKDRALMPDSNATKAFQQAGRDFQQMGTSFQAMLKSMDKAMKNANRGSDREPNSGKRRSQ